MKKWIIAGYLLSLFACQNPIDTIVGEWRANSAFYQATYEIIAEEDHWNGQVLYYHDGTTKYRYDGRGKRYLFTGLKKSDGQYIDGISGATATGNQLKSIEINKKHEDTLEVTTYVMNKPIVEIWTRKNKN